MTPFIKSERLYLTTHSLDNLHDLHHWRTDPEIVEMSSDRPLHVTFENSRQKLERWIKGDDDESLHFAIHLIEDQRLIGFSHIVHIAAIMHVGWRPWRKGLIWFKIRLLTPIPPDLTRHARPS